MHVWCSRRFKALTIFAAVDTPLIVTEDGVKVAIEAIKKLKSNSMQWAPLAGQHSVREW